MSEYKRLTKKTDDFYTIDEKVSTDYIPCMVCEFEECEEAGICDLGIVIDRLAQYEDLGLSPEDVAHQYKQLFKYVKTGLSPEEITGLAKAKAEGRLVVLPTAEEDDYKGLKGKYHVFKVKDNTAVYDCFVMRPQKDQAAVAALRAYADTCENEVLSNDILGWLRHIETEKQAGGGQDG